MITLQQLLMTDTDLSGGTQTGKGAAEGAQDFLSLLAGALNDTAGQGKEAPLTLADLKAAGGKLAKLAQQKGGDETVKAKLADLLSRQAERLTDTAEQSLTGQTPIAGLIPMAQGDVLKTLTTPTAAKDDAKTDLSEEELAGLSALMAMLPHQQTPVTKPNAAPADAVTTQAPLTQAAGGRSSLLSNELASRGKAEPQAQDVDNTPSASVPLTPFAAAMAAKQESASTPTSTAPTATLAPIMAPHAAAQPAAAVASAPIISQPLGTHEWQQAISQHVTLFTRQGQQSAELRLHPEDLGQVQISLKLDDNQAQLQMISAHSHVRAALEAALPMLRTQLADNGIQLTQSSISSDSSASQQQSSSGQQQHAPRSGQQGGFNEESDELLTTPASLQSAARGTGAVDIFA
ncbi:flagellar hook length control protein FliK [Huaxiibacter chinensis]|uniref:flagellar hook length control protein FliK n=1 Tax=Huaxiibacter chinensis TaxID=2899785 RepID=UPI003D31C609